MSRRKKGLSLEEIRLAATREMTWMRGNVKVKELGAFLGLNEAEVGEFIEGNKRELDVKMIEQDVIPTQELEECLKHLKYSDLLVSVDSEHALLAHVIPILSARDVISFGTLPYYRKKKPSQIRKRVRVDPFLKIAEISGCSQEFQNKIDQMTAESPENALLDINFIVNKNYKYWFNRFQKNRKKDSRLFANLVVIVGCDYFLPGQFTLANFARTKMAAIDLETFLQIFGIEEENASGMLRIAQIVNKLQKERDLTQQTILYSTLRRMADNILGVELHDLKDLDLKLDEYEDLEAEVAEVMKGVEDKTAGILAELDGLDGSLEEALDNHEFREALDILPNCIGLANKLDQKDRVKYYKTTQAQVKKEITALERELHNLESNFQKAYDVKEYAEARAIATTLLELASELKLDEKFALYAKKVDEMERELAETNKQLAENEKKYQQALKKKEFNQCMEIINILLDLGRDIDDRLRIDRYTQWQEKIQGELDKSTLMRDQLEEEFQIALGDKDYDRCLEIIPQLLEMFDTGKAADKKKLTKYRKLKTQIEKQLAQAQEEESTKREELAKIERLKKKANGFEEKWRFTEAREVYEEILEIAKQIDDELTIELCNQKFEQIAAWESEIEDFDMLKWDLAPFKILNRRRYDFYNVFPLRPAAEEELADLIENQGLLEENGQIVKIVRSKFKAQGPFSDAGECYSIYYRKTVDLMELE